jgi:hypothetical protein
VSPVNSLGQFGVYRGFKAQPFGFKQAGQFLGGVFADNLPQGGTKTTPTSMEKG